MGDRGSKQAYTPMRTGMYLHTKFGCYRSIVVGCKSRNDRQTYIHTYRQTDKHPGTTIRPTLCETWRNNVTIFVFSALTLLVGHLGQHPACKESGLCAGMAICLGRGADNLQMAQLISTSTHHLFFYLSGAGLPRLNWKEAIKRNYYYHYTHTQPFYSPLDFVWDHFGEQSPEK